MFFDDIPVIRKKGITLGVPPPFADTGWRPPQYFPNLSNAIVIGFDVETYDPELLTHGPGWARGVGWIVGFSIAALDRRGDLGRWYFPVRHTVEPEYNLDPKKCFAWLKTQLETPHIHKSGQNLLYDIGWLTTEGIHVEGELSDSSFAEALLDSDPTTNLDYLAHKYLDKGKEANTLYQWLANAYGGAPGQGQRANIYRAPPRLVGPYGEADASLPIEVLQVQWPLLVEQNLTDLFKLECNLIRLLVRMRLQGVTIDINATEKLYRELQMEVRELYGKLSHMTGRNVESVNSGAQLAPLFDAVGIAYRKTKDGNPSFTKEWLKEQHHPLPDLINSIRELEKLSGTFVKSYMLEGHTNVGNNLGKIYCSFNPLRSDDGGTLTGRFSSSDPNLQNIPARTKAGKKIRAAFVKNYGHFAWEKCDYSQIEYRMLAHFATSTNKDLRKRAIEIQACEALRDSYRNNPKMDYHENVYAQVAPIMGWEYPDPDADRKAMRRKPIKNVNFGMVYGQSEKALAFKAGMDKDQASAFFKAYHDAAPYVRATMAAISEEVQKFGYITTILGRRVRFDLWEPSYYDDDAGFRPALSLQRALNAYGPRIRRAYAYRGVNYKLQGSGTGDVIKNAMVKCYNDGVFDVIGVPLLQVHDELDFSVIDDSPMQNEAYRYMHHVLQTATPCNVPIMVDHGRGDNWASIN